MKNNDWILLWWHVDCLVYWIFSRKFAGLYHYLTPFAKAYCLIFWLYDIQINNLNKVHHTQLCLLFLLTLIPRNSSFTFTTSGISTSRFLWQCFFIIVHKFVFGCTSECCDKYSIIIFPDKQLLSLSISWLVLLM